MLLHCLVGLQFKNINSNNRLYKEFKDEIIDVLSYGNKNILKRDIIDGIDDISNCYSNIGISIQKSKSFLG